MVAAPFNQPTVRERRVLVVDDNRLIADTLAVILRKKGYSCLVAYSGEEALRLANRQSPDLLVSDIVMPPGMNGCELASRISARYPRCSIVLNTAESDTGSAGYLVLQKPVPPVFLLWLINGLLG